MPSSKGNRFRNLRHFTQDGLWASVCEGIAENNFVAFALTLAASASQAALFASSQQLAGCWFQLWSEKLIGWLGSRKRLVLGCVAMQIVLLCSMALAALQNWPLPFFLACAVLFTAFGSLSGPAWNAWVGDLLPTRRRGACFAIRNQRTYPMSFFALVAGGALLDQINARFHPGPAFCLLFCLGAIAKVISLSHLMRQKEPPFRPVLGRASGPFKLIHDAWKDQSTRRIGVFFGSMGFAVNLCGPFQAPYALKTLGLSYVQYTFLLGAMVLGRLAAAPYVGRGIDRLGSRGLLLIAASLMPTCSLGWCLTRSYAALAISYLFSGFVWAAFDMCSFTYLTEYVPAHRRARTFVVRQTSWSLASFLGASAGSALLQLKAEPAPLLIVGFGLTASSLVVFWASTLARTLAAFMALRMPSAPAPHPYPVKTEKPIPSRTNEASIKAA